MPYMSESSIVSTIRDVQIGKSGLPQSSDWSETVRRSTRTRRARREWWKDPSLLMAEIPHENLSFPFANKVENNDKWVEAVNCEIHSLEKKKTLVLVSRENDANVLTTE